MKNTSIRWIKNRTKKTRFKMALLILGNAIFSILLILFAFAIKKVVDSAVARNMHEFTKSAIFVGGIVVLQFFLRLFNQGLEEDIKARIEINCKSHIFSKILVKKYEKINGYHSGELINRLTNDVNIVSEGVTTLVPSIVAAVVRLISAIIALILLDAIFVVAFILAGILVFLIASILGTKLKHLHKKTQESEGKTRSFMQEIIENLLSVKVFSVNDKVEQKANELQEKNYKVKMKKRNFSIFGNSAFHFIFSAGYVFALIFGGYKLSLGIIGYGDLSAILQLVNNVQVPLASLSSVFSKYYSIIASAERLMEIEEIEEEQLNKVVDGKSYYKKMQSINISNVTFGYEKSAVLKNASLTINKGDFLAIMGTSGIGKSTLIKLILGVYLPEKGEISLSTKKEKIILDGSTRNLFAYVPQGNALFSGTIRENISFINSNASQERIKEVLNLSCCLEFIEKLPNGLETEIGEQGEGLSEGQVQRIAIARALLSEAPILLFDEATSALDEETEKRLLENLKTLKDVTLILITHKKAALSMCNRKIKIKKGTIVENE